MYLKNINVTGFKSFGGKNVLDFPREGKEKSRSFTAVVGPNGSGKSNIADAIRWVLGEQSSKLLRVKKGEDVIFFGSSKKGKGSFTEISMTLDNSSSRHSRGGGNLDPRVKSEDDNGVDLSEIEISRRLYRNGDNDYFINRKKVRLLDIQELLAKCGFGRSTYTVIGQGMVDSLLFYGPAERKVLFEEASGVKQYEIKRAESIRKLDATDKNIIRIKDLLYELEPRLRTAERQNKKWQKKQEIETELDELSRKYYSNMLNITTAKKTGFEADLAKLREKESKLKSEIAEIEAKIAKGLKAQGSDKEEKDLRSKIDELSAKRDELSRAIYRLEAEDQATKSVFAREKEEILGEQSKTEKEISDLKENIQRAEQESAENQTELDGMKKELSELDKRIIFSNDTLLKMQRESLILTKDDIRQKVEAILAKYQKVVEKMNSVQDLKSFASLKGEAESIATSLNALVSDIKKSQNADTSVIEHKQREIKGLVQNKEKILNIIQDLRVKSISYSETVKNSESRIKEYEERLALVNKKVQTLQGPAEKDTTQVDKLALDMEKVQSEIDALKDKLVKLEGRSVSGDYSKILDEEKAKRAEISQITDEINSCMVELARIETKDEDLKSEIHEFMGEAFYKQISESRHSGKDQNPAENVEHMMPKIQSLRKDMYALGEIDHFIKEEFEELSVRVGELNEQLGDLEKAKTDILKIIGELDVRIKTQFKTTFAKISEEFTKYFKILFDGGNASLNLETDEEGEFGVEISATPPGKKNQSLNSLSGGERAMTSIALLFAILSVNPSPFCVLDEVDASLDESNTERFLEILKTLSHKTQFVVVTHNRESMKKADIIYGVSMDDNHVSQVYSLKLTEVGA